MPKTWSSLSAALASLLVLVAACSSGSGSGSPGAGGQTGSAGAGGVVAGGGSPGGGGHTSGAGGDATASGGSGGAPTGGATGAGGEPLEPNGGTTGATGGDTGGGAGAGGVAGAPATGGSGGGGGVAGAGGAGGMGGAMTGVAGSHGNKVLIYTKATGFVHASTPTAAAQITKSATAQGLVCETSDDMTKFTAQGLAPYAVIVLLATTGTPFGSPGTDQIQALVDWVHAGGGLVAIENADHAYDDIATYVNLIGGDFNGHSAGMDTCVVDGTSPVTQHLPATFMVNDEIYYTMKFRMDNQVVLRCGSDKRPIAWVRQEGMGRVFYEALGHYEVEWTTPPLVDGLVIPGLLWSMGRPVP